MQITFKALASHCQKSLSSVYLIHTDALTFATEARECIQEAAVAKGFTDKEIIYIESHADWQRVMLTAQNKNLFGSQRMIDIRLQNAKLDSTTQQCLQQIATTQDDLMIITMPKLTAAQQKTAWYKSIDQHGVCVVIAEKPPLTIFDLSNTLLMGNSKKSIELFHQLSAQGIEPILMLWSITKEIRELIQLQYKIKNGYTLQQALQPIWSSKKAAVQKALQRLSIDALEKALQQAAMIDRTIKGAIPGNPSEQLQSLGILLCDHRELIHE